MIGTDATIKEKAVVWDLQSQQIVREFSPQCRYELSEFQITFYVQSNSNIVESNIVENSNIVDDLEATKVFYFIKIQNSRNPK